MEFFLSLFQKQGRLVDFLQQDIASFSNAEVGEAARVVHAGAPKYWVITSQWK